MRRCPFTFRQQVVAVMDKKYVSGLMMLSIMGVSTGDARAAEAVAGITASPAPVDTAAIAPTDGGTDLALNFDLETLRSRGVDPSVAKYFARSARFAPGTKVVGFSLNGNPKGSIPVTFDNQGQPCVDRTFLQAAGLKIPKEVAGAPLPAENAEPEQKAQAARPADADIVLPDVAPSKQDTTVCYDYANAFPGTVFSLFPTEDRIELVTPPEALQPLSMQAGNYNTGGTAAMLNYSLFSSKNSFEGGTTSYKQGMFEAGFNVSDWLLRSKQMVSETDGKMNRDALYTYAQHTFTGIKKIAQVGQINVSSTLFSGSAINGAQLIPETALDDSGGSGITVTGIAQTPQARVDIRQSGALIYSTLVPVGPFTLDNVPVISANTDLDVTVTETSGSSSHFTVSAASLSGTSLGRPQGLSMAVGKVRDVDADFEDPWLATVSNGWQATKYLNVTGGLLGANKYQAVAGGIDITPVTDLMLSAKVLSAADKRNNNKGEQITLSANYAAPYKLSFGVSGSQNSLGYRDLQDTFTNDDNTSHTKNDLSFSTGWSNDLAGSFSLGYSRSVSYGEDSPSKRVTASWGRTFKYASVSVNWQHEIDNSNDRRTGNASSNNRNDYRYDNDDRGDTFYVNVSIPFGTQSVNTYARNDGQDTSYGVQTAGSITPDLGYTVSAENTNPGSQNSVNGGLNANLHYTRLSVNAGGNSDKSRNTSATLDGAIVAHSGGVTFSPYAVQDTFGIASLGDHVAGVEISTPQGTVWTDKWGQAVIPALNPYKNSNVMVNTETLPKNVDVNNGMKSLTAGHGSVSKLQFGVLTVRRAMLKLIMPDGKPVQKGAVIFDSEHQYVTTAVEDGVVFVTDAANAGDLYAQTDDAGHKCKLKFSLAEEPDLNEFYENVGATCQAE
ncbi:fimbrial biogenesis usher protein [Enterobacteriaceae bacterium Kacie_13]|nr:fimbrial biogenesis usher protein [Enterobacteriaceae bacterium Kacie_13]